ncbi:MAG: flagellar hook-associated protein FlgL [Woeseiaceae bacterium]|nr:flagellar hook-associated protein FlgL [Woeseiaceae bacterium]
MRVSTMSTYLNGLTAMQRLQSALDQTQRQISTGRRILTPSDDPIASARALEMRESIARLQQFDRNAGIAQNRLAQEESALASVNDVLQRVRELAIQANNATQSDESRSAISVEMRQLLDGLVQIANQKDGNGRYMFSGLMEDTQPVTRVGGAFNYNGDQGQRFIQIGESRQLPDGDSGADVFFRIRAGNGAFISSPAAANTGTGVLGAGSVTDPTQWDQGQYTVTFIDPDNYEVRDSGGALVTAGTFDPGDTIAFRGIEFAIDGEPAAGDQFDIAASPLRDVFTAIDNLIAAVEMPANDGTARAAMNNGINAGVLDIDRAIDNILDVRTKVGSRLAAIEKQVDDNGALVLTLQDTVASIEDLDYAEALSRLSQQLTTLEAAQQSFVRTQGISLFNYL